jgi:hypothetical protein
VPLHRDLSLAAALAFLLVFPVVAQTSGLAIDTNSKEVKEAQTRCTQDMAPKLLADGVRKTKWGAREEAFIRCKEITGWQSPK